MDNGYKAFDYVVTVEEMIEYHKEVLEDIKEAENRLNNLKQLSKQYEREIREKLASLD